MKYETNMIPFQTLKFIISAGAIITLILILTNHYLDLKESDVQL